MTEHTPSNGSSAVSAPVPQRPAPEDAPTSVLPTANSKSGAESPGGDQTTALQKPKPKPQQPNPQKPKHQQPTPAQRAKTDKPAGGTHRRRRAATKESNSRWRTHLIVMAIIYAAAVVLGVLIGLWITNSMSSIPGVS